MDSKSSSSDRFEDVQLTALIQLRFASVDGDYDLAWSIFKNYFDLHVISQRNAFSSSKSVGRSTASAHKQETATSVVPISSKKKIREMKIDVDVANEAIAVVALGGTSSIHPHHEEGIGKASPAKLKSVVEHAAHATSAGLARAIDVDLVEQLKKNLPPGLRPPNLEVFRLLMTSFKVQLKLY